MIQLNYIISFLRLISNWEWSVRIGKKLLKTWADGCMSMDMLKKDMWMYLVAGFVFAAYLGLPVLGVSLIGIVFAGIHDYNYVQRKKLERDTAMELEGGIDL